ncbi:hypothetical protein [Deinococcus sp.]|uniref:hypothetical protein n=1 Tax=Deinococcus sp. TaxID=47478 RepID=UPI0025C3669D|nr:hypothetical protein [Deinococcus sp.]
MGEGKPSSTNQTHPSTSQPTDAPASVTAPEGSRADAVADGANTNFGPTLTEVPAPQNGPSTEPEGKKSQ